MTTETATRALVVPEKERRRSRSASRGVKRSVWSVAKHVIMILLAFVMLYPLLWMVVSSLRPNNAIFTDASIIPNSFQWSNYTAGWNALSDPFSLYLGNSIIIVLGAILGNLLACSLAAYAFARLEFRFKRVAFTIMLLTIMLPFQVTLVPQYIMFSFVHMLNTFWPLILPKVLGTDSFFIFLMVQFIRGIPRELDEAARIDGCGHPRIFFRVILPLMTPALATTTIFTFIWMWNEFFGPIVYLTQPHTWTVQVALGQFIDNQTGGNWGALFAMSVVSLIPVFLAFLVGQRFLIRGIATTGIK
ncbi:carbohydrate ABC transporter permease [Planctomonas sp. JC2975]|uniref:carbohydrate ABC transporter permease n=1 Tax=Planctomonas sp. JC2975 TaxID=2729626 RepID=UPI001476297C|nr:carbohydrate ABC transporter permease [Planctomonas sp. JC2975]NNC13898.1 carbohydrate ABC transporter permease [Planctomonas sp. JC2975]